jgi:hypothetical protein
MQPVRILPAFLFIVLAQSVKSLRGLALSFVVVVFQAPGHGSCVLPSFHARLFPSPKDRSSTFFQNVDKLRPHYTAHIL